MTIVPQFAELARHPRISILRKDGGCCGEGRREKARCAGSVGHHDVNAYQLYTTSEYQDLESIGEGGG